MLVKQNLIQVFIQQPVLSIAGFNPNNIPPSCHQVWQTNATNFFERQADIVVSPSGTLVNWVSIWFVEAPTRGLARKIIKSDVGWSTFIRTRVEVPARGR